MMRWFFIPLLVALLTAPTDGWAQKRKKKKKELVTFNTEGAAPAYVRAEGRKRRSIRILKRDPSDVLYGNRCVSALTNQMGIEYVILTPDDEASQLPLTTFGTNLGNSILLMFRHGPFWSVKVRKRIRQCRESSGDFVGFATPTD